MFYLLSSSAISSIPVSLEASATTFCNMGSFVPKEKVLLTGEQSYGLVGAGQINNDTFTKTI